MQENPALISLSDISMEDLGKMDKETQLGLLSNASVSDLSDFSEEKITALKLAQVNAQIQTENLKTAVETTEQILDILV